MALLAAPGVLLSSTPEAVFDDRHAHRSMAGALASLGLAAVALVVLTRLPAEGTALFESASIAAWALSARVAACWLPPDQILPRKACESLVAGAAAGALYLAHADATLLATIRLVCLAGALNSAGRAHVAGALLAAAVEAPKIFATAFLAASLALLGAAVRPPRRDASRFEDRVAARPDRAVVLAVRGLCASNSRPAAARPPRHRRDTSSSMARRCGSRLCRELRTQAARGPPRHGHRAADVSTERVAASAPLLHRPLFAAAAAYAARRLRAQHASSLGDAFARQGGRAGAGADAAAFASYAAAAAHARLIEAPPGRGGLGRRIVRRARAALPARAPERGEAAALAYFVRVLRAAPRDGRRQFSAGRGLGPRPYIMARAHGARPRRRPRSLGACARRAGRRRRGRDARPARRERGAR